MHIWRTYRLGDVEDAGERVELILGGLGLAGADCRVE